MKKIIAIGVISGIVLYTFLSVLSKKVERRLEEDAEKSVE
jgi:hypothetical protein